MVVFKTLKQSADYFRFEYPYLILAYIQSLEYISTAVYTLVDAAPAPVTQQGIYS